MCVDGPCNSIALCGMCAVLAGEALPGPLMSAPHQEDTEGPRPLGRISLWDFPLEQTTEKTLRDAFDQVKVIDGQWVQPNVALAFPHFVIRLYQVKQDTQTKEETTQLLVPKSCWEMLFQADGSS